MTVSHSPGSRDDARLVRVEDGKRQSVTDARETESGCKHEDRRQDDPRTGPLNVGKRVTDERPHVAAGDDHRIDAGTLELEHIVAGRSCKLGDDELSDRNVREQLEQALQVILAIVSVLGGEKQDLGVDQLQHGFELVLISHEEDTLEPA